MKRIVSAFAALAASAALADARVSVVDADDLRGGMNVVTNVDLSGFVTNVDAKLDRKQFRWEGTNRVYGAEFAEKAKEAKAADLATRALQADAASKLKNAGALFDDVATNKSPVVTAAFSNAVEKVSPAPVADMRDLTHQADHYADVATGKVEGVTQAFSNAVHSVGGTGGGVTDMRDLTHQADHYADVATGKVAEVTLAFSNAVSKVSVDGSADAAALAELLSGRITQSRKTLLISNIVEYILKKEGVQRTEE